MDKKRPSYPIIESPLKLTTVQCRFSCCADGPSPNCLIARQGILLWSFGSCFSLKNNGCGNQHRSLMVVVLITLCCFLKPAAACPSAVVVAQSSAVGAMAAAGFLTASADTPGVKHLLSPLTLHIGALSLHQDQNLSCCCQLSALNIRLGFTTCLDCGVWASPFLARRWLR